MTRAVRTMAAGEAAEAGAARPAPRKRLRAAASLVVAAPVAKQTARYLCSNWAELRGVRAEAAAGLSTFFSEQLWSPCQAIVNQILFRERSNLMDRAAIDDAETSLQNMLRDFLGDKRNKIPDHIRREAVKTMDMSVVSRQLEQETRGALRGTVNGRIPRMLLIQAAFLKKELLHAMEAIDELFQANQVTLRLISVVPAALVILGVVRASKSFVHAASSRRLEPTTLVHRSMRASVREMERLLTSSRGFVGDQDLDSKLGAASRSLLSHEETGKLAFHLHGLQTTLRQNNSRFEARTRRGLEEDLADITGGNGLTVVQQVAVVRRMQRSYPFLRPAQGV